MLEKSLKNQSQYSSQKVQINEQLMDLYLQLAVEGVKKKNYEEAMNYYKKCLISSKEMKNQELEVKVILKIAKLSMLQKSYESTISLIQKCLGSVNKLPKNKVLSYKIKYYKIIAECFNHVQDFEEAENYYKNFYEMLKEQESEEFIKYKSLSSSKLAHIYWQQGNKKDSIKYQNESFELNLKIQPKNWIQINESRISLGIVKGLDNYHEFIDFIYMSKMRNDDIITYKKTGNFC